VESATGLIVSRRNPLLRELHRLKSRAGRGEGVCLLEGEHLVEEALHAGLAFSIAALTPAFADRRADLERRLRESGVAIRRVRADIMAQLSELDSAPGILAVAERPSPDPEGVFRAPALAVAACGVQDPGNLGALLRNVEAAGAGGALLGPGCADPLSWKALRGSMGSALRVPVVRCADEAGLLAALARPGVRSVAADAGGRVGYDTLDYREPTVFVVGGEGRGLPDSVREAVDVLVAIPMRGRVESLNVAVASGILLFEAARQRRLGRSKPT
jgi:TrmH family RNA methyltransferase